MPRLLKKDCIRLAEASIEALALAQLGISSFHRIDHKEKIVRFAPETGLIGSAIELIMSAILVQAYDRKIILKNNTRYKTASEILSDFRDLLRQKPANLTFLTNGIADSEKHINQIHKLTTRFKVIITSRANALHNGIGLNYDILSALFQEVSMFIGLISESINFKPYINRIPKLIVLSKEKQLLIDEIFMKIKNESNIEKQKNNIASLFLLLPEVPKNLPQWLEDFERFNIAPKENDIVNLINALEKANPVNLRKVKKGIDTLAVRIDNNNPDAIPIQPQFLKGNFTTFHDRFYADISNANGRLNQKQLDLPPPSAVLKCIAYGLNELNVTSENNKKITAHQAWPSIASAIQVSSNGISFPIWRIIKSTSDYGQLISILKSTSKYGNLQYQKNITEVIYGINCVVKNKPIDLTRDFYLSSLIRHEKSKNKYAKFSLESGDKSYVLSHIYSKEFDEFEKGEISISELGNIIIKNEQLSIPCKKYWIKKIADASTEIEVLPFLYEQYLNNSYTTIKTDIKKTFRAIDLVTYGPRVNYAELQK